MSKSDPFKFGLRKRSFDTLYRALKDGQKHPFTGVTQGGSSRKNPGCKPAATDGEVNQIEENKLG